MGDRRVIVEAAPSSCVVVGEFLALKVFRGNNPSSPQVGPSHLILHLEHSAFLGLNQILFCHQLEIFLSQRAVEMSEEADILSVSQFQLAPAILQGQTKAKMVTMVSALQDLIGRLTNLRMQHLFMILASPRSGFLLDIGLFGGIMQGSTILSSRDSWYSSSFSMTP